MRRLNYFFMALVFVTAGAFGVFLIYTQNFILGLLGLSLVLISMHETGHIWAPQLRGYEIKGLILSVFGPGVYQDKPLNMRTVHSSISPGSYP